MKYTIFKTEFGFFGLLAGKNALLRTSLPAASYESAQTDLLVGLNGASEDKTLFQSLQKQIIDYFDGKRVIISGDIPIGLDNYSDFTKDILSACRKIPYGQTVSYSEVSAMAGRPKAIRAAGNALGNNPLPLIIPCHRVIKSDGTTGRFQKNKPGAANLKKEMLQLEAAQLPKTIKVNCLF